MNISIELPEDIVQALKQKWGDVPQHAIETLALEGYRSGTLSTAQVRRMLGFKTRIEVDSFLKQHGVYLDYTTEDLERDVETLKQVRRQ